MEAEDQNELRKIVREVVTEAIAPLATREEMQAAIAPLATREEMQAAFDHQAMMIQQEFRSISQRLTALEARVASLENRVTSLENRVIKLDDNHNLLAPRLNNIDSAIGDLRTNVRTLREYVVERNEGAQAELASMKATAAHLEEELRQVKLRIGKLEAARHG